MVKISKKISVSLVLLLLLLSFMLTMPVKAAAQENVGNEPYVTHNLPETLRVGDSLDDIADPCIHYHNLAPGELAILEPFNYRDIDELAFGLHMGGEDGNFVDDNGNVDSSGINHWFKTFYKPGVIENQPKYCYTDYPMEHYPSPGEFTPVGEPIKIKVEEPIITDNAPAAVKVGSQIQLNTELTNVGIENEKVSKYEECIAHDQDMDWVPYEDIIHKLAYQPSVEIIDGEEIVEQSNQDYSNTLYTSETLTFNSLGTVKLKITYHQINTCGGCLLDGLVNQFNDTRYHPERVITINVTESGLINDMISFSDEDTGIKLEAETGVVPPDTVMKVEEIKDGESFNLVNDALKGISDKWVAYDISLLADDVEIQPEGKVKIMIPCPMELNANKMVVYRVADDGTLTEVAFELDEAKENISFETERLGLYAIAEIEDEAVVTPGGQTNSNDVVKTGDYSDMKIFAVLSIVSLGVLVLGIIAGRKHIRSK